MSKQIMIRMVKRKNNSIFSAADIKTLNKLSIFLDNKEIEKNSAPKTSPSLLAVGDLRQIDYTKLDPKNIEKYLLLHPVVPRGIEMKVNRMIRRGYTVKPRSTSKEAIEAAKYCSNILENSGGPIFLKRWMKDCYSFGDGYWTLVPNKLNNEILKLNPEHPIFFRPVVVTDEDAVNISDKKNLRYVVDPKTREVASFNQVTFSSTNPDEYMPSGKPIAADYVLHLILERNGDEVVGISLIQYVYMIITYLLNTEESAAETLYRCGFTQKKVTTEVTSEVDLKKVAKNVQQINSKDAIILPKGMDVVNLMPGTSDFPKFHDIFIELIAIRLGIPIPLLTMSGVNSNKSVLDEMRKDILADYRADEIVVEQLLTNKLFKFACCLKYGNDFEDSPIFLFNDIPEDEADKIEKFHKMAISISNISTAVKSLSEAGVAIKDHRVLGVLNYMNKMVLDITSHKQEGTTEEEVPDEKTDDILEKVPETPPPKPEKIIEEKIIGKPKNAAIKKKNSRMG